MCGCIFKAKRLFLALLLCIGCTAVSNPASAVVCFLPDAEGCGDNGINYTPVICDGTNNFTQDLCNTTADKYSSKERHYFCVEEGTGCYVLDSTPCFESIDYDDCPGCLNSPKDEQYNCITTIQGFTRHVCSDKGISSEERDSRTQYLCREKKYKQEGCDTFDLSEAEKNEKEATGDYICSECIKDMYTSDYDGNWNRTGDGDTVYSCHGKVACNQTESDCTADQKFVADGTTDEYQQTCGVCQEKIKCTKVASDCGSDEKFIADGTTDDDDHTCGKCETKIKCSKVASDCTGEQTFVKDGTTDDYNNECGTCKEPDKKTCQQLELKTASECNSATQTFNSTRTDDYGTECGNCVAKKTCNNLGYKTESECKTSNQKFTAASPAVKDEYGTVCGGCGNKKTCKDMGYKTASEASANERFNGNNITDDYNTPCGTLELKKCSEINATYKIAGNCSADETFAGNGTKGQDGDCGKCNLKTCAGITSGSTTKNKCTEACYTGFNPNGKTGSDGACGVCAPQCPSGYTKDLSSCGSKDGYVLTYKAASCTHSVVCGTCNEDKKACPTGYNTKYQTKANCETISGKKVTGVTFNGQSGETKCGQCQYEDEDTCPTGYKANVTCGEGFTKFENPNHKGCYQCQCRSQGIINGKCTTCAAEGYTESVGPNMECDLCPINEHQGKNCKCTATCPTGYSEKLKGLGSCGAQPLGWDFEGKTICGGTITCGKCTAKTCPAGTDTSKKACAYPESLQIMGYTGDKACTRCTQPTCPNGTYATQTECQKLVPTNECAGYKYTGACKKGSISGCWKPLGTMSSKAVVTCANGTCSLGFCLVSGVSNSGYYGNACVQDVQIGDHHTWKGYSESTGFNYTAHQGGISSCSVTKGRNTDCSRSTSYSSTCRASMVIGPSQWDQDDGKW